MKRLAVFIGSLLVLPAFAEVAPVVFEDFEYADVVYDADGNPILLTEYTDTDTDAVENAIIPSVSSSRGGTATRANTNRTTIGRTVPTTSAGAATGRASAANSSRAVAARTASNSSPRSATNSRSVSSRSTTSRTTSTAATRTATGAAASNAAATRATGGAGRTTATRTASSGGGTVARTATSGRTTTSSRTATTGARVNRASTNAAVAVNGAVMSAAPVRLSGTTTITGGTTLGADGTLYIPSSVSGAGATSRVSVANRVPAIRMSSVSGLSTDTSSVSVTAADLSAMDELAEMTDYCKAQYAACMDNYCNVLDDNQGRCSCSANINNYAKAEAALKSATEELQEVAQKIQYIGLSAREVQTLFTATEAELEMQKTTDTTQLKINLDKIRDMIIDVQSGTSTSSSSSSFLSFDLSGLLDFTIDSTGFDLSSFLGGFGTGTSAISNQRGAELFKTATNRCKANVLNACTAAGVDASLVTNAYDLEIDKECLAYERSLNDSNDQMVATVRNAKSVLQKARLLVEQSKNEYDMRGCINALDSCMQDEYVCGSDYEKCLDPSGRYIVNGEIVIGSDPGRAINGLNEGVNETGVLNGNICSMNLYNVWNYGSSTPGQTNTSPQQSGCTNAWNSYSLNSGNGDLAAYINETVSLANAKAGGLGMSQFIQNKIGYNEKDRNYGMCMSVLNKCQDYTYTGNGSSRKYNADNEVVKQYLSRVLVQIKAKQDEILAEHAESCITDVTTCLSQNNYPFDETDQYPTQANIAINACRSTIVTCMSVNGYSVVDPTPADMSRWVCGITTGTTDCTGNNSGGGAYHSITWIPQQSSANTSSCPSTFTTSTNSKIVSCNPGTVSGYIFTGWCTNTEGTSGCYTNGNATQASIPANYNTDIVFYGQWRQQGDYTYEITYDCNFEVPLIGSITWSETVTGNSANLSAALSSQAEVERQCLRNGYAPQNFVCTPTNNVSGTTNFGSTVSVKGDITCKVDWMLDNGTSYVVTYNCGNGSGIGGTAPSGGTYSAGTVITMPGKGSCTNSNSNQTFAGWRTDSASRLLEKGASYTVNSNVTFTAVWNASDGGTLSFGTQTFDDVDSVETADGQTN